MKINNPLESSEKRAYNQVFNLLLGEGRLSIHSMMEEFKSITGKELIFGGGEDDDQTCYMYKIIRKAKI